MGSEKGKRLESVLYMYVWRERERNQAALKWAIIFYRYTGKETKTYVRYLTLSVCTPQMYHTTPPPPPIFTS